VTGSCRYGNEPSGSGATDLVVFCKRLVITYHLVGLYSLLTYLVADSMSKYYCVMSKVENKDTQVG
jgi:hypothetical protein